MKKEMFAAISKNRLSYILLSFYFLLFLWWIKIYLSGVKETDENYLFGFLYSLIALTGGVNGLLISKVWGGYKSLVGRGIIFLSLGLLGEWFGQTVWTYYNVIERIEIPYPSIADIGYFSIIPFYALGMLSFAKASGAKLSIKTLRGKLIIMTVPVLMVSVSYFLFLKNLSPDFSNPIRTFLDFGYPFGEAITISIALITFGLSRGILGGRMKIRILYLIFAFIVQYVTDYTFLYTTLAGTYYNAGIVDLMYATSFTIMAIGIVALKNYEE
jgi:hypothetical protein